VGDRQLSKKGEIDIESWTGTDLAEVARDLPEPVGSMQVMLMIVMGLADVYGVCWLLAEWHWKGSNVVWEGQILFGTYGYGTRHEHNPLQALPAALVHPRLRVGV
jgi:hypothetical protein